MILKDMFKKTSRETERPHKASRPEAPEGILRKCNKCGGIIIAEEVKSGYYICPKCHGYFRIPAYRRIEMIVDADSFEEWDCEMDFQNPLAFRGYEEKVKKLKESTGLNEAVVTGRASVGGNPAVIGVCDGRFLMASMGEIVGEKITRAIERATEEKLPVILFACSGGARMQEGIVSLMQMAKTSAALKRHHDAGQLYLSVLTDPTTGGVTASFAMLGDIILAEPKALIGFAGPRVIEQTIGEKLPKGFQRAEFLLEHGFIDRIVEREELKDVLTQILAMHQKDLNSKTAQNRILDIASQEIEATIEAEASAELKVSTESKSSTESKISAESKNSTEPKINAESKISTESKISAEIKTNAEQNRNAWDRVLCSRKKDRPVGEDYIHALFDDFMEFHGDRYCKDDPAIVGGIARFHGKTVTVIAQAKGKTTKENITHNFGMPSPDGYRKALRLMKQAEKFDRPIICFVDTPGAFCGLEAEERGQGEAIARNLYEMSSLKVPVLSIVIGEGGSGGALAMAVANEVWMLENAIYSILSPEGFASILWKDSKRANEAAEVMKLTAEDLKKLGMIERMIEEPEEYTCDSMNQVCQDMERHIADFLIKYEAMGERERIQHRYERFRNL